MNKNRHELNHTDLEALYAKIRLRGIILYGTGYLSGLWTRLLRRAGLEDCIRYYVVSGHPQEPEFENRPVYRYEESPVPDGGMKGNDVPILGIAMHEAAFLTLGPETFRDYPGEWIFLAPWFILAAFGDPIAEESVPVRKLLAAQPDDQFWITIRYAVLCEHFSGETDNPHVRRFQEISREYVPEHSAKELYLLVQNSFSGKKTAEQRLERFLDFAERGDLTEILLRETVVTDSDFRVIDGLHRIALAVFSDLECLPVRIMRKDPLYSELFTEKNQARPEIQRQLGFGEMDMKMLQLLKKEIHGET